MKPSFLALFKRGRYYRTLVSAPTDADKKTVAAVRKVHKEQERFTAAALAFCFKHDEKFKYHFWTQICRGDGDPERPQSLEIDIEPPLWADLLLRSNNQGKRFVHVVECKIDADLDEHQDPREDQFEEEGGYGRELVDNTDDNTGRRYIVLGYRDPLKLPKNHSKLPIQLAERKWDDLEIDYPKSPLIDDLLDSLGEMGVGKFRMRTTKKIKVTDGLNNVGKVWDVLRTARETLEFVEKYCLADGGREEDEGWSMGTFVHKLPAKQGASDLQRKLSEVTNSPTQNLAWFGYKSGTDGRVQRQVWLYCADNQGATSIKGRLRSKYPNARLDIDDEQDCVVLSDPDHGARLDVDWFITALRAAGALAA